MNYRYILLKFTDGYMLFLSSVSMLRKVFKEGNSLFRQLLILLPMIVATGCFQPVASVSGSVGAADGASYSVSTTVSGNKSVGSYDRVFKQRKSFHRPPTVLFLVHPYRYRQEPLLLQPKL